MLGCVNLSSKSLLGSSTRIQRVPCTLRTLKIGKSSRAGAIRALCNLETTAVKWCALDLVTDGDRRNGISGAKNKSDICAMAQMSLLFLAPEIPFRLSPSVTKSRAHHFTAVVSKLHNARMAPALDDFPIFKVRSVHGTRCIRVELPSKDFEDRLTQPSIELP